MSVPILTDGKGQPFSRPARKDYPSDETYRAAFYAYRDRIAAEANAAFAKRLGEVLLDPGPSNAVEKSDTTDGS